VVVIAGAIAVLASAMTPLSAAERVTKAPASKPLKLVRPKRVANTGGGSSGMLSLEWTIGAMLRP